jgi:hypothetical protein
MEMSHHNENRHLILFEALYLLEISVLRRGNLGQS